jgi:hypothetical protein
MKRWADTFQDLMAYLRRRGWRYAFQLQGHLLRPLGMPSPRQEGGHHHNDNRGRPS